jgi:hypothetical protein
MRPQYSSGHTRILSLWDQLAVQGTPPAVIPLPAGDPPFSAFGNECSAAQIDAVRQKSDLVVTNTYDATVSLFLGGPGGLVAKTPFPKGQYAFAVAAADFNGDGNVDLITGNLIGSMSLVLGNGKGGFTPQAPTIVTPYNNVTVTAIAAGDFNGDGIPDVVGVLSNANQIVVLDGSFVPNTNTFTFGTPFYLNVGSTPDAVAVGDLNGDGTTDIVVANYDDGTVSVFLSDGKGGWNSMGTYPVSTMQNDPTYGNGTYPSSVAIGDFNGDGIPDLAVASWGRGGASDLARTFRSCLETGTAALDSRFP